MWKVIIVDDEVLVRRGLASTIPWAQYGMQVAGDFSNGMKALEAMELLRPDVVITDIRMPQMDGLTLLKELRKQYPETIPVILSCHNDFEYAKEAISLGAVDYLVKTTMDDQEVDRTLSKVQAKLAERKSVDELLRQIEQSKRLEKQAELRMILAGGENVGAKEPSVAVKEAHRTENECFLLLAARPWAPAHTQPLYTNCLRLEERFPEETELFCTLDAEPYMVVLLWFPSALSALEVQHKVQIWSGRLLQLFGCRRDELFIGAAPPFSSISQAKPAFEQAKRGQEAYFYDEGVKTFYMIEGSAALQEASGVLFTGEDKQLWVEALVRNAVPEARALFEQLTKRWRPGVSLAAVKEMASSMIGMIRFARHKHQPSLPATAVQELQQMGKLSQVKQLVSSELAVWEQEAEGSSGLNSLRPEIQKALAYIQQHLHDELKMSDVADHVHLSRSHFSALFKQAVGKTFLEYMMEQKMEWTKEQLKHTHKKIYEIASEIGFSDYKYFTRCFKEYSGMTPKDWREQHVHKSEYAVLPIREEQAL
ncbi:response regulator transcription factor [Paenibacillus naphthalenovorans]|uniref:response regulator transcription factor n=1 Tax=Paenibacillus naphthalenovorans TaxID=162209 RepID=UPI003D2D030C